MQLIALVTNKDVHSYSRIAKIISANKPRIYPCIRLVVPEKADAAYNFGDQQPGVCTNLIIIYNGNNYINVGKNMIAGILSVINKSRRHRLFDIFQRFPIIYIFLW